MKVITYALVLFAAGGVIFAQQQVPADVLKIPHAVAGGAQIQVEYIAAEFGSGVVRGAPYSAEAVTETVQTLADGNRIVQKSAASLYRDSQGRTRREQTLKAIGLLSVQSGEPMKVVTISDPVAGVSYSLDSRSQTATKMPLGATISHLTEPGAGLVQHAPEQVFEVAVPSPEVNAIQTTIIRHTTGQEKGTTEQLGKQVMEGVEVEGTRDVTAIPAGQLGNERPIEVVSERWYSPKLQTVVMSKRSDPRMGETVYRLTNINLSEPPASLFQVPPDYTVKDGPQDVLIKRIEVKK